ncbi:hypothetical protein [Hymenobacter latericus]|uniref:hypothetical protein n=1 Tax=Hymenobacter sp. YIM 151858-1 TaxID=2987688 RepID=UPI002227FD3B|nr:hypothetical protein [Hymenobacter sp. YIM 151858-1]UYZ60165.1 hypothetical protein OIS50_05020 [Hymenobacter sp. YIM 151858-1]
MNRTWKDVEAFRFRMSGREFLNLTMKHIKTDIDAPQVILSNESELLELVKEICRSHGHAYPEDGAWNTEEDYLVVYQF